MGHHRHHTSMKSFIHGIAHETKVIAKATKPLGHIIESGLHTAEHIMTAPIHELGSLGKSLGSSLSIPLVIGGVVVIYFLMRK